MSNFQKRMILDSDARFVAAVCCCMAESNSEARDYFAVFEQRASPHETERGQGELGPKEIRDILLCTARTAVHLLEG